MSEKNVKVVILNPSSKIIEKEIPDTFHVDFFDYSKIQSIFTNKGDNNIERYCSWTLDDSTISLFGWKSGKEKNINKTEIPPPEDTDLYYGDLLFIKSENENKQIVDFTKKDYEKFYNTAFDGFESLGSEDSYSEGELEEPNEYDSDDSFIDNSEQEDLFIVNDDDYVLEDEEEESDEESEEDEDEDEDEEDEESEAEEELEEESFDSSELCSNTSSSDLTITDEDEPNKKI